MTTALAERQAVSFDHIQGEIEQKLPQALLTFLDISLTATDRATYYNKKGEQNEATAATHRDLIMLDRGIYGMCLLLPGTTDFAKQMGMGFLLDNPRADGTYSLSSEQEGKLLAYLSRSMEPQRLLKLFGKLRKSRVNNRRTRSLIIRSILMSPKLDYWAIKYRWKLRQALEHAWNKRTTGILTRILAKKYGPGQMAGLDDKEESILGNAIDKYVFESRFNAGQIRQCVAFILGHENRMTVPILKLYKQARTDLEKGKGLPKENLFYLRSRFHKDLGKDQVYEISKPAMTSRQKMQTQKAAKKAGVAVEFDPRQSDSVKLYIYAYEMGMDDSIRQALDQKARRTAGALLTSHKKVGILVDASESHQGDKTQALRPIAIALATRDMLVASAEQSWVEYASGSRKDGLVYPCGETALGRPLVRLLKHEPDAVYVISDGYENAPSGEFDETVRKVRSLGIRTPIYHVGPVMAAESGGLRELSDEVRSLPISQPEGMATAILRSVLESDLQQGLAGIARAVLPALGYRLEG